VIDSNNTLPYDSVERLKEVEDQFEFHDREPVNCPNDLWNDSNQTMSYGFNEQREELFENQYCDKDTLNYECDQWNDSDQTMAYEYEEQFLRYNENGDPVKCGSKINDETLNYKYYEPRPKRKNIQKPQRYND
jgi:hypothetical protein